jgi:hypothetical protein
VRVENGNDNANISWRIAMSRDEAEKIIDKIIDNLSGRCGIGDEWHEIDEDIQEEIKEDWIAIVLSR